MSPEEQTFIQQSGAEILGCSQRQVLCFEKGRRRVPVFSVPDFSKALGSSIVKLPGTVLQEAKK